MPGNGPPLSDAATVTLLASIYQPLAPALAVQIWFAALSSGAALIPSPIIQGNLVQFNCGSVCKEELGRKLNCFPGWAFKVQTRGSANSLWDCGEFLPKYSSESMMKVFLPFLLGSPQILFPARSCCVPDGCHQNCAGDGAQQRGHQHSNHGHQGNPPGVRERHSLPMKLWGKPPPHATA